MVGRRLRRHPAGYTLMEMVVVAGLVGILFALGPPLLINIFRYFRATAAKAETQRDSRNAMDIIGRNLRQAQATSVTVSRYNESQPYYSKISFTANGQVFEFWQEGRELKMSTSTTGTRVVSTNLRTMAFTYPETNNAKFISVALTMERMGGTISYAMETGVDSIQLQN